ncbi:uncharacterized protein LOC129582790 [Paramacrobiotus metropolitanus]|uniref:uncharacterized protein LOC129582790 n=1 Tax=Paramacrobiotus metropolitanus TaxID=2943436 RepID=UPI0024460577|nr:uncharacterized protein LOC129582790 [Paramacrobiotus metropolitanus]
MEVLVIDASQVVARGCSTWLPWTNSTEWERFQRAVQASTVDLPFCLPATKSTYLPSRYQVYGYSHVLAALRDVKDAKVRIQLQETPLTKESQMGLALRSKHLVPLPTVLSNVFENLRQWSRDGADDWLRHAALMFPEFSPAVLVGEKPTGFAVFCIDSQETDWNPVLHGLQQAEAAELAWQYLKFVENFCPMRTFSELGLFMAKPDEQLQVFLQSLKESHGESEELQTSAASRRKDASASAGASFMKVETQPTQSSSVATVKVQQAPIKAAVPVHQHFRSHPLDDGSVIIKTRWCNNNNCSKRSKRGEIGAQQLSASNASVLDNEDTIASRAGKRRKEIS